MRSLFLLLAIAVYVAVAQIPCDDAYGTHCPEAAGYEVGDCLKKVDSELSAECRDYIQMTEACRGDIDTHCAGKEYTGDALGEFHCKFSEHSSSLNFNGN